MHSAASAKHPISKLHSFRGVDGRIYTFDSSPSGCLNVNQLLESCWFLATFVQSSATTLQQYFTFSFRDFG
jgi:hypothetical protein